MHAEFFADDLQSEIRARFHHVDFCPVTRTPRIFFENGGGSLKLKTAIAASSEISALPDQEGRDNPASTYLSALIARGREDLYLLFGAPEPRDSRGQVISGETGTRLLYRIVRTLALALPPGPMVSSTLEHPASLDATRQWAAGTHRQLIEVPFSDLTGSLDASHYEAVITPDTRIATVIHTSMLTGFVADLRAICEAIRRIAPDCFIVVDGIQHAPHGALDVASYGADAYVFSPYKAFSRLSMGFAWISQRVHAVPHEHMLGKTGADWELGSRDPAFFAAQSEVVDYYCWLGSKFSPSHDRRTLVTAAGRAIARHESALVDLLISGDEKVPGLAAHPKVSIIGPPTSVGREGLISFTVKGANSADLVQAFAQHGIRVHARISDAYSAHILGALGLRDCVRVSMAHYNTPAEVRTFLEVFRGVSDQAQVPRPDLSPAQIETARAALRGEALQPVMRLRLP